MQNITIGRYGKIPADVPRQAGVTPVQDLFDGWIEGVRDDGTTWIMWLDAHGSPTAFYAERDEDGGVASEPVNLARKVDGTNQPS
ncbi:hypothetical protein OS122_02400 [Mycolicibacterium mucogenicum]|uniref:hypothetical protein n=1 Tax=Mycolicibacterium mucogenicum TaxID=56689 RepID=UPI00226A5D08|nr:hypothetical protein [Mycolicibacterium mucogenicum]MCX8559749.1 hypothetical protein [Mycolicibacterium mucogenicum]